MAVQVPLSAAHPPTQRSACRCGGGIAKPMWRPVSLHLHRHGEVVRTARNTARLVLAGVGGHPASMAAHEQGLAATSAKRVV